MASFDLGYDLPEALGNLKVSFGDLELFRGKLPLEAPKSITDKQLLLFLNACGNNVDEAARVVNIFYESRRNSPEHFRRRDPNHETIKQCFENQKYFVIPPFEKNGCPIVYHKITNPKASTYCFDNAIKTYCMTMDAALYKYGPGPGIIFLHDMEYVGFSHMLRASISSIRKFLQYLQYGLPAKVCRIHIFNVVPLFSKILTLLRPFLKKELIDIIYTHPSDMNYEEFYKEWIPKSHLPSDYGGDLKTIDEMHNDFYKEMLTMADYFIAEENQREGL